MTSLDFFAFAFFLAVYTGYHLAYIWLPRLFGMITRESRMMAYREAWFREVQRTRQPILAIQLVRNLTMGHTFFGMVTLVTLGGVFSYVLAHVDLPAVAGSTNFQGRLLAQPETAHMLAAAVMLLISFLNFVLGTRVCFNLNFTLAVPPEALGDANFPVEMLQRQARHYILGVRTLYFTGPLFLWAFHPVLLIVGSALIGLALFRFDFLKSRDLPVPAGGLPPAD